MLKANERVEDTTSTPPRPLDTPFLRLSSATEKSYVYILPHLPLMATIKASIYTKITGGNGNLNLWR